MQERITMPSIGKFLMWRCYRCGLWQGQEVRGYRADMTDAETISVVQSISLTCKCCGASRKLKKKRVYGIDAVWFNEAHDLRNNILIKNGAFKDNKKIST